MVSEMLQLMQESKSNELIKEEDLRSMMNIKDEYTLKEISTFGEAELEKFQKDAIAQVMAKAKA